MSTGEWGGVLALFCAACAAPSPAPPLVVMSIPCSGNAWESIGLALAAEYNARVPRVAAEVVLAESLESQADSMEDGKVDLALEDAETAYLAYTRGTDRSGSPHQRLRAIGVMFSSAVQVAVPASTGIERIAQLRGKRVEVGTPGGAVERAARIIFESRGVSFDGMTASFGTVNTPEHFTQGDLDARVFYSAFKHPTIAAISREVDVRVLPIERRALGAIKERHHFLKTTTIPAGTYPNQPADGEREGPIDPPEAEERRTRRLDRSSHHFTPESFDVISVNMSDVDSRYHVLTMSTWKSYDAVCPTRRRPTPPPSPPRRNAPAASR